MCFSKKGWECAAAMPNAFVNNPWLILQLAESLSKVSSFKCNSSWIGSRIIHFSLEKFNSGRMIFTSLFSLGLNQWTMKFAFALCRE